MAPEASLESRVEDSSSEGSNESDNGQPGDMDSDEDEDEDMPALVADDEFERVNSGLPEGAAVRKISRLKMGWLWTAVSVTTTDQNAYLEESKCFL